jgi:hypothetical protein
VYVVPSGYTLVVTDWEFAATLTVGKPGDYGADYLVSVQNPNKIFAAGFVLADPSNTVAGHKQFTTGIRFGSGVTPVDYNTVAFNGSAFIQGSFRTNQAHGRRIQARSGHFGRRSCNHPHTQLPALAPPCGQTPTTPQCSQSSSCPALWSTCCP